MTLRVAHSAWNPRPRPTGRELGCCIVASVHTQLALNSFFVVMLYTINMKYLRDERRIHLILYHLVFCPKRRKPVLVGSVAADAETLIRRKCEEQGWRVVALEIMPDHVHLFVRVWPTVSAAEVVKAIKRVTAHEPRRKHPDLLKLPSLWTRSYLAATAGNVSQEAIRLHIEAQKGI